MRLVELNKGWKVFGIIMLTIIILAGIFCAVAGIMAHIDGVGFVAEIQSWFEATKETLPDVSEEIAGTVSTLAHIG